MEYMHLEYFNRNDKFPFFIQYGEHGWDMPIHCHCDFSELSIVLNGSATHIVGGEEYFIKKGDVFVINGNTSHGFTATNNFEICNIMYDSEHLNEVCSDIKKSLGYQALFVIEPFCVKKHNFESKLKLEIEDYEKVKGIITNMIDEYQNKYRGYQTLVYSCFMQLVVFLSRRYELINIEENDNIMKVAKVMSYIENHFKEQLTLKELADRVEFSVRHFNRIFKENYKVTPMEYILTLRIEFACSLLKKSTLSISDIAYQSGFNDSNYFARQFKKNIGCSPKDYRMDNTKR